MSAPCGREAPDGRTITDGHALHDASDAPGGLEAPNRRGAPCGRDPRSRSAKGRAAEEIVSASMLARGWDVVARNWKRGRGELDIVAAKDGILAVVEVKDIDAFGLESVESSVGGRKRARIVETSKLFIHSHREFSNAAVRYDVATVAAGALADYFENAFSERT